MITIFFLVFLIQQGETACEAGCLKCSDKDECQICDALGFYKLTGGKCEQAKVENCLAINLSGQCLQCKDGYYIEPQLKTCIEIGEADKTDNCKSYDSKLNCIVCMQDYFIAGSFCKAQEKKIENCLYYLDAESCLECASGFIVSIGNKSCESVSSISNCQKYSKIKCVECLNGYTLNELAFESNWFAAASLFEKDKLLTLIAGNSFSNVSKQFICQKQTVTHCKVFKDLRTCLECEFGYYLSSTGGCIVNPFPSIAQCKVYSGKNSCSECQSGFYRQSEISCIAVTKIANCIKYSPIASTTECVLCETQFYLNGTEKCIERDNRVENCFEYEVNLDICKQCSQSFVLTDDKLKCLQKVENCIRYKPSSFDTKALTCFKCGSGYHLNNGVCEKGTIDNCEIYDQNSQHTTQICERCKNQFALNSQTCVQSQNIANCMTYHPFTLHACQQCQPGFQNLLLARVCVDKPLTSNCIAYTPVEENNIECSSCDKGYYLTPEKKCQEIPLAKCVSYVAVQENFKCEECEEGYFLWDERCVARPLVHSKGCSSVSYNEEEILRLGCNLCEKDLFPLDLSEVGVCFESDFVPTTKRLDNCVQYDAQNDFDCLLCKEGYVLDGSPGSMVCSETCSSSSESILRSLDKINKCTTDGNHPNCSILARSYNDDSICIKCKTGYLQIIEKIYDTTLLYSMTNASSFFNLFDDLHAKNFNVKCVIESTIPLNSRAANCEYYQYEQTTYKCIKCKEFHTGAFTTNGGISACSRDNAFTEKKLYNVNTQYGIVQSGFVCTDDLEIPWINVNIGAEKGLCSVDVNNLTLSAQNTLTIQSNFCANPSIVDVSFQLPANCGTIITKSNINNNKCELNAIQCLYCKPKFAPTKQLNIIQTCTFISHCIGDLWFDACSKCETGYSFKFVDGDVLFTECVENTDANCFAKDTTANKCKICEAGYTLLLGVCELIVPQKCKQQKSFQFYDLSDYYDNTNLNYKKALQYTQGHLYTCVDCQQGYTSIKTSFYNFCIQSTHLKSLQTNDSFTENDYYIQNCLQYNTKLVEGNQKHGCVECETDLIAFESECITPIANCAEIEEGQNNTKVCAQCNEGFGLKNLECVTSEVSHCKINETFNECKTCVQGYFLDGVQCTKAEITHCSVVTDLLKCQTCEPGYLLYQTTDRDYCFPKPLDVQCKKGRIYQDVEFGAEILCTECPKVNQLLLSDSQASFSTKTVCAAIEPIEHCIKYKDQAVFQIQNFDCAECAPEYYLKNNKCELRKVTVANCEKYSLTQDTCILCQSGYYFENESCTQNPFGIQGCIIYESASSCLQCETNKFSQQGNCFEVNDADQIENCEIYKTGTLCDSCSSGYFLKDNTCVKTQLQNCLEFESATVCKKCADQYELKVEEGKATCQKVEKVRCLQVDLDQAENPCVKCEFLFYVNKSTGNCDEVPKDNIIDNCISYLNDTECEKCEPGYVLSFNKLACSKSALLTNQIPDNCKDAREEDFFCSICQGGFFLNEGKCQQCGDNGWDSGCYYCLSGYEGCYICRPGFYMNKDQKCVQISSVFIEDQIEDSAFSLIIELLILGFYLLQLQFLKLTIIFI